MTLIFAHRGANREAPENTKAAFDKALAYPIDGIETDIQLSRDEVAVLWHDRFLDKIGLPGRHIDDYDYDELLEMTGIMTLAQFLASYEKRCRLLLEIKNRDWEESDRHQIKVRQTLGISGKNGSIVASSFHLDSLIYAHRLQPDFPLIYNVETDQSLADAKKIIDAESYLYGLCLPIETLDEPMAQFLRERKKCLAVYTCNSDAEIEKALALEVDILISDLPQKALSMRKN